MKRLLTPGWLVVHTLALLAVAAMLGLAVWQYSRAQGGNTISWGYLFQWPAFAAFTAFVWWREVRRALRAEPAPVDPPVRVEPTPVSGRAGDGQVASGPSHPAPRRRPVVTRRPATVPPADEDPQLAAYNRYLAWLRENPGARPGDYPG